MKKGLTITALVATIAVCGVLIARNLAPYEDDGYVSSRERAIIKKFDKDGDGALNKLEQREADAAIKASEDRARTQKEAWLKRHDKNGDGKISEEEKRAAQAEEEARRAEAIRKFDTNGDGELSREEREAAGREKANREAIIKKFDKDSDGKLNEEEKNQARKALGRDQ